MSVQVRRRREAAAFLSTYVGAQGELLVDTTNNRVQIHDGATPGGWPAARLADIPSSTSPLALTQGGTGASAASASALLVALGSIGRTVVADARLYRTRRGSHGRVHGTHCRADADPAGRSGLPHRDGPHDPRRVGRLLDDERRYDRARGGRTRSTARRASPSRRPTVISRSRATAHPNGPSSIPSWCPAGAGRRPPAR